MSANVRFGIFLGCMIISWENNQAEKVPGALSFEGFCKGGIQRWKTYRLFCGNGTKLFAKCPLMSVLGCF